jgi:hypothetical protein
MAQGSQAFIWALVFFLVIWVGALLLGAPRGTSFVLSLLVSGAIWFAVRHLGDDSPGPR